MAPTSPFALPKPQSMKPGMRNVLRYNDSASLWNCTLSPGWTTEESETLRKAVTKFGIGNWAKIIDSGCLPGKTNAQMNLQLQRLLGQQSTAEFASLHIDPKVIGEKNSKIQGPEIKRKNNTIVNTGGKLSREALRERVARNREMYELPEEEWQSIELSIPVEEQPEKKKEKKEKKGIKDKVIKKKGIKDETTKKKLVKKTTKKEKTVKDMLVKKTSTIKDNKVTSDDGTTKKKIGTGNIIKNKAIIKQKRLDIKKLKKRLLLVQQRIEEIAKEHPDRVAKLIVQVKRSATTSKTRRRSRRAIIKTNPRSSSSSSPSSTKSTTTLPFKSSPLSKTVTNASPNKKMRLV